MGWVFQKKFKDRRTGEMRTCARWTIKYYDRAGRQCEEATGSKHRKAAERMLRKREADKDAGLPVGPEMGRITFNKAVEGVYDDYTSQNRRTLDEVKRRVRLHLAPFFWERRLSNIGTDDVQRYTAKRLEEKASAGSVRLDLSVLKRTFRLAMRSKRIATMPYIPMPAPGAARRGFFEAEHVTALIGQLPAYVQPIIRFGFVTGWRVQSEVLPLEWRQVDLTANEVRLEPGTTKNGEGRTFSLTPGLKTLLEDQLKLHEAFKAKNRIVPWVFPDPAGEQVKKLPRRAWQRACKAAGCPGRMVHDFRRTAVRNLVRAGVSERVAMQMTGHLTRSVFDRYHIVSPGDLREASAKLATITDSISAPKIALAGEPDGAKSASKQGRSTEPFAKAANSARSATR